MKWAVLILAGLSLAACGPRLTDFNPPPVTVSAPQILGTYNVAVVGSMDDELTAQVMPTGFSVWGYQESDISSDMSVIVGDALRRAVGNAMRSAISNPTMMSDEAAARAAVKQGVEAIIIRFSHGHVVATEQEGSIVAEVFVTVDLYGTASFVGLGGREVTLPLAGTGNRRHRGRDLDGDVTPVKTATETAISRFAASAASAVGTVLGR